MMRVKDSSLQSTFVVPNTMDHQADVIDPAIMPLIFPAFEPATLEVKVDAIEPMIMPLIEPAIELTTMEAPVDAIELTIMPFIDPAIFPAIEPTTMEVQVDAIEPVLMPLIEPAIFPVIDPATTPLIEPTILPINAEEQALYDQLNKIFGTPKFELTKEEQQQVDTLNGRIDELLAPDENGEWPELTEEQDAELGQLFDQIDDIYGIVYYEDLSEEQQREVDGIYAQLDKLWAIDIDPISEEEQALYDQLDEIFGTPDFNISEDEQKQVDELNSQIDEILSPNENGEWPKLTDAQEAELDQLFAQIDEIYGIVTYASLSEEQQAQVDSIYAQLDELRGDQVTIMPVDPALVDTEQLDLEGSLDIPDLTENSEGEWLMPEELPEVSTMEQDLPEVQTLELPGVVICDFGFNLVSF